MGIVPQIWGPYVWATIHLICLGAPERFNSGDAAAYRIFFENLPNILPCETCKEHLIQNLKNVPMDTAFNGGRDTLFAWSVKLHNQVNQMLGKPVVRYEDAAAYWISITKGAKLNPISKTQPIEDVVPYKKGNCLKNIILMVIVLLIGIMIGNIIRFT